MSFDWLSVPGLQVNNELQSSVSESPPLPNVSFNFNDDITSEANSPKNTNQARSMKYKYQTQDSLKILNFTPVTSKDASYYLSSDDGVNPKGTSGTVSVNNNFTDTQFMKEIENYEELNMPLTISSSMLDKNEEITYKRWYKFMESKRRGQAIQLEDIFGFFQNFHLSDSIKERIRYIFRSYQLGVNMGQFFAIMRVISHSLNDDRLPTRHQILEKSPVPRPKSILSTEIGQETYEEVEADPRSELDNKVDFDSFASLLLTGKTVRKNIRRKINKKLGKVKKVAFSENLVTFHDEYRQEDENYFGSDHYAYNYDGVSSESCEPLDYSEPMENLLKKMAAKKHNNSALVSKPATLPETAEEREELADMRDSLSRFKQIQTADNVTLGGFTSHFRAYMANNNNQERDNNNLRPAMEPLRPTATGSANRLFRSQFPPKQTSFQDHTQQGESLKNISILDPLKPTATGSANQLFRTQIESAMPVFQNHLIANQNSQNIDTFNSQNIDSPSFMLNHHFPSPPVSMTIESTPTTNTSALQIQNTAYLQPSPPQLLHSPQNIPAILTPSDSSNNSQFMSMQSSPSKSLEPRSTSQFPIYPSSLQQHPYILPNTHSTYVPQIPLHTMNPVSSDSHFQGRTQQPMAHYQHLTHSQPQGNPYNNHFPLPSQDILSDLRALKQQVDQIHNTFMR